MKFEDDEADEGLETLPEVDPAVVADRAFETQITIEEREGGVTQRLRNVL
jgi:hypothetical protein